MDLELPRISLDAFVALTPVLATPWLFQLFSTRKGHQRNLKNETLSIILLLHTVYMLYSLLVAPPASIFKMLDLPITIPPDYLRAKLAERFGGLEHVPGHLALLSKRLSVSDLRLSYVRLGHDVLTGCGHCQSTDDFVLYALPIALLEYIREIAFIGLLTLPRSPTAYLRPLGLGALLTALLAELYWTLTVQVRIPAYGDATPVTMWHDTFIQLRHLLFLLLPLIIHIFPSLNLHHIPILGSFLPSPPHAEIPPSRFRLQGQRVQIPPNATLNQMASMTNQTLGHLVPTLHLLKYTHAAIMRSQDGGMVAESGSTGNAQEPDEEVGSSAESSETTRARSVSSQPSESSYNARASTWWAEEAQEGRLVRDDPQLRELLKRNGLSLDEARKEGDGEIPEGQLLTSARMAIQMLKEQGARPSDHWVY